MPRKVIACGECYSYAYARVRADGGTLVHATVRDPWSGKKYGHAWVEDGGYVYDWQTSVGLGTGKPRTYAAFYSLYQPEQLRRGRCGRGSATPSALRALVTLLLDAGA